MIPHSRNSKGPKPINQMIEGAFFAMHPYPIMFFKTDKYYNEIAKKLLPLLNPMRKLLHIPDPVIMRMALSVTAYLEDQCSHLGLWSTFIHEYRDKYGRWLPWYDTTSDDADYYDDEVNLQDVKFILWMILVSTEGTPVVNPEHEAIRKSAEGIFELLKDEFELAPVNKELVDYVYGDFITEDFYSLKNILRWMTSTCYLMGVPMWQMEQMEHIRKDILRVIGEDSDPGIIPYLESSYECVRMTFGPLALYPKDWYVRMRQQRGLTKDNKEILEIESTPFYPFMIVSNDGDTMRLRSCRDIEYVVDTDSFGDNMGVTFKANDILLTSLVCYKGHWGANGLTTPLQKKQTAKEAEALLKKMGEQLMFNNQAKDLFGLPDPSVKILPNERITNSFKEAVEENGGDRLFYFHDGVEAMKWQNKMAGSNIEDVELFRKTFGDNPVMVYVTDDYLPIASSMVRTIKDPKNPYYNPSLDQLGINWIYNKSAVMDELAAYLVKRHFLANLVFNPDDEEENAAQSKLIEENLPFFATFLRQYPC